jgi:hypothetical protein
MHERTEIECRVPATQNRVYQSAQLRGAFSVLPAVLVE